MDSIEKRMELLEARVAALEELHRTGIDAISDRTYTIEELLAVKDKFAASHMPPMTEEETARMKEAYESIWPDFDTSNVGERQPAPLMAESIPLPIDHSDFEYVNTFSTPRLSKVLETLTSLNAISGKTSLNEDPEPIIVETRK